MGSSVNASDFELLERLILRNFPFPDVVEFEKFMSLKVRARDWDAEKLSPSPRVDAVWHAALLDTKAYERYCSKISQGHQPSFIHHDPFGAQPDASSMARRNVRYSTTVLLYTKVFRYRPPLAIWPLSKEETEATKPRAEEQPTQTSLIPVDVSIPALRDRETVRSKQNRKRKADETGEPRDRASRYAKLQLTGTVATRESTIYVQGLDGKKMEMKLDPTTSTVLDLKRKYEIATGMPAHELRFIYGGKMLSDGKLLSAYNITSECVISLLLSLRGC